MLDLSPWGGGCTRDSAQTVFDLTCKVIEVQHSAQVSVVSVPPPLALLYTAYSDRISLFSLWSYELKLALLLLLVVLNVSYLRICSHNVFFRLLLFLTYVRGSGMCIFN